MQQFNVKLHCHTTGPFYVCQDGKTLSLSSSEAGKWDDETATDIQLWWIDLVYPGGIQTPRGLNQVRQKLQDLWQSVQFESDDIDDVKVVDAVPDCNYCGQASCPDCGHLNFIQ